MPKGTAPYFKHRAAQPVRAADSLRCATRAADVGVSRTRTLVRHAVRSNVRTSASQLRHGSEVLEQLIQSNGLLVVDGEYSLETGLVDFFDGVPSGVSQKS